MLPSLPFQLVSHWVTEPSLPHAKATVSPVFSRRQACGHTLLSLSRKYRLLSSKSPTSDLTWPNELPPTLLTKQIPRSQHLLPCAKQRQHKYKALLTSIASVIPHRQPVSVPARGNLEEVIDSVDRFTGCPQIHPELIADGAAACEIVQLVKT